MSSNADEDEFKSENNDELTSDANNNNQRREPRLKRSSSVLIGEAATQQLKELFSVFETLQTEIPSTSKFKDKINETRNKLLVSLSKRQKKAADKLSEKSKQVKIGFRKVVRKATTGDEQRSLRRHMQEAPQVKMLDKACFTLSITHLMITEYLFCAQPRYFPYYYSVMLILLMIFRYVTYNVRGWQYFMLDLCYFVNFVTLIHVFIFPESQQLFEILFGLANGPTLWAIVIWRNSMVFHSTDKMTSLFIHVFPPLYSYHIRRHAADATVMPPSTLSVQGWLVHPIAAYAVWQMAYLLKTEVMDRQRLESNPNIITSLRWLATDGKNFMNRGSLKVLRACRIMGKDEVYNPATVKTKIIFVGINFLYFFVTLLPSKLLYENQSLHLGAFLMALVISIFNGANYYVEVFSARYLENLEKKEKKLEETYQYIDENLDNIFDNIERQIENDSALQLTDEESTDATNAAL